MFFLLYLVHFYLLTILYSTFTIFNKISVSTSHRPNEIKNDKNTLDVFSIL